MADRITSDTTVDVPDETPAARFGRIIKAARADRQWSQPRLAEEAEVSLPTVQRYEAGATRTPSPEEARRIILALGLDPRLIPVILGYVTREEMGLPSHAAEVLTPTAEEALRILQDPSIPAAAKEEWLQFLKFRISESSPPSGHRASAG